MDNKKEMTWRISGMHCPHCNAAILRAVRGLDGLENPRADYKTGALTALWNEAALNLRVPLSSGDNIVEFTVDEPRVIPYTCWMGMLRGSITAVE